MMSVVYLFWMFVFLFGVIGAVRGWAKELMVIFSVVTALAVNLLLEKYVPLTRNLVNPANPTQDALTAQFWIRSIILVALVFFGYQTVNVSRFASKAARERLQDSMFGAVLGGVNGYLVAGSLLFYNHMGNYPFPKIISRATDPQIVAAIDRLMQALPPRFLAEPQVYFVVIIILIFIIVVYI
ncbi:MAG: CvpA family protein [Anaerolineales bacterium]|nr:CvpA family protein [Anaerolineales bacterium]